LRQYTTADPIEATGSVVSYTQQDEPEGEIPRRHRGRRRCAAARRINLLVVKPEVRVYNISSGPTVDSGHKPSRRKTIRPRDSPAERGGPVAVRGDLGGARTRDQRIKSEMLY
jgi:hypothetical protein